MIILTSSFCFPLPYLHVSFWKKMKKLQVFIIKYILNSISCFYLSSWLWSLITDFSLSFLHKSSLPIPIFLSWFFFFLYWFYVPKPLKDFTVSSCLSLSVLSSLLKINQSVSLNVFIFQSGLLLCLFLCGYWKIFSDVKFMLWNLFHPCSIYFCFWEFDASTNLFIRKSVIACCFFVVGTFSCFEFSWCLWKFDGQRFRIELV